MKQQLKKHTTVVQCERPDLGTRYALFTIDDQELVIRFGNPAPDSNLLQVSHIERLPLDEYEEAALLFDGVGWNIRELAGWIQGLEYGVVAYD